MANRSPKRSAVHPDIGAGVDGDVLRMVLYFDVFKHPLQIEELVRLVAPETPEQVRASVAKLVDAGMIDTSDGYCHRTGRGSWVQRRAERAVHAERLWPMARRMGRALARTPYVRAVFITGGLSKNSAEAGDDVDFLLLVEPGRVWTLKSMLQLIRRTLPPHLRSYLCTNYLLSNDSLELDDRTLFTAVELATAVPVAGRESAVAFIQANDWAREFVPGLDWSLERARATPRLPDSVMRGGLESLLGRGGLEQRSLQWWDRYWNEKYSYLDEDVRAQRFKRREEIATNHLHDFQDYVHDEVRSRFDALGVAPPLMVVP